MGDVIDLVSHCCAKGCGVPIPPGDEVCPAHMDALENSLRAESAPASDEFVPDNPRCHRCGKDTIVGRVIDDVHDDRKYVCRNPACDYRCISEGPDA